MIYSLYNNEMAWYAWYLIFNSFLLHAPPTIVLCTWFYEPEFTTLALFIASFSLPLSMLRFSHVHYLTGSPEIKPWYAIIAFRSPWNQNLECT